MNIQNASISNQLGVLQHQGVQPPQNTHVEIVDGATYEVTSNYIGDVTMLDIFKQMLKRDIERLKP